MTSCVNESPPLSNQIFNISFNLEDYERHRRQVESEPSVLDPGELVYEMTTFKDKDQLLSQIIENGELRPKDIRFSTRPYGKAAQENGDLYHEGSYSRIADDGSTVQHYEVRREPGVPMIVKDRETRISRSLGAKLSALEAGKEIEIIIGLKGFSDWDIEILPSKKFISLNDWANAKRDREQQITDRIATFQTSRDRVLPILERFSATLVIDGSKSGFLHAKVNSDVIAELKNSDVDLLDLHVVPQNNACVNSSACGLSTSSAWRVGQGRSAERLYVDPFHQTGYNGGRANSSRHNHQVRRRPL